MIKSGLGPSDGIACIFVREKIQVPGLQNAIDVAIESAFEIMADDIKMGREVDFSRSLIVRDEHGRTVHVVRFSDFLSGNEYLD